MCRRAAKPHGRTAGSPSARVDGRPVDISGRSFETQQSNGWRRWRGADASPDGFPGPVGRPNLLGGRAPLVGLADPGVGALASDRDGPATARRLDVRYRSLRAAASGKRRGGRAITRVTPRGRPRGDHGASAAAEGGDSRGGRGFPSTRASVAGARRLGGDAIAGGHHGLRPGAGGATRALTDRGRGHVARRATDPVWRHIGDGLGAQKQLDDGSGHRGDVVAEVRTSLTVSGLPDDRRPLSRSMAGRRPLETQLVRDVTVACSTRAPAGACRRPREEDEAGGSRRSTSNPDRRRRPGRGSGHGAVGGQPSGAAGSWSRQERLRRTPRVMGRAHRREPAANARRMRDALRSVGAVISTSAGMDAARWCGQSLRARARVGRTPSTPRSASGERAPEPLCGVSRRVSEVPIQETRSKGWPASAGHRRMSVPHAWRHARGGRGTRVIRWTRGEGHEGTAAVGHTTAATRSHRRPWRPGLVPRS